MALQCTKGPEPLIQWTEGGGVIKFAFDREGFVDIITIHLIYPNIYGIKKEDFLHFHYMAIFAPPLGPNLEPGAMNFIIQREGFMNIITMHVVLVFHIYMGVKKIF